RTRWRDSLEAPRTRAEERSRAGGRHRGRTAGGRAARMSDASALIKELGEDRVRRSEILAPYTTFKIGGPADLFYEAQSAEELVRAVCAARASRVPYFVLGLGANILVGDG